MDSIRVCGVRVDMVQISDVLRFMEECIVDKRYGSYIVVANANDVIMAKKDGRVLRSINSSSLIVPDGISLIKTARLYGYNLKRRVYGAELMLEFFKSTEDKGYTNFFYGSTQKTLFLLTKNLKTKFPRLNIKGVYSPPFRELTQQEDEVIVDMINNLSPDVLWVGLGCPKQQLWMYEHRDKLKVPVMVGVGAAFDFIAGTKPQAPRWIRDNGFEWLFRLITEPRRLWKRYLIGNTFFVFVVFKEFLKKKFLEKKYA